MTPALVSDLVTQWIRRVDDLPTLRRWRRALWARLAELRHPERVRVNLDEHMQGSRPMILRISGRLWSAHVVSMQTEADIGRGLSINLNLSISPYVSTSGDDDDPADLFGTNPSFTVGDIEWQ